MISRDSSIHVTEDGDAASSGESEERGVEESMVSKGSDALLQKKMDNLRALLRKKKKVEEEIARARAELQQALQP